MKVVLTREAGRNDELRGWLPAGAEVDEVELTTTSYVDASTVEHDLLARAAYGSYAALVVTSARSEPYVPLALAALARGAGIYSVGAATTRALARAGAVVEHEAHAGALELDPFITRGPVLMLGARGMREALPAALAARGFDVDRVTCYETRRVALDDAAAGVVAAADVIVIGAPSAWSVARALVRPATWVVVPGASTAEVVRRDHERVLEAWGSSLSSALASLDY